MKQYHLEQDSFVTNQKEPQGSGVYIVTTLPDKTQVVLLRCPLCMGLVNIPTEFLFFGDKAFFTISSKKALQLGCCKANVIIVMDVLSLYVSDLLPVKRKDVVDLLEEEL